MIQKKMLVVDDDADIREMITTFFIREGYMVCCACDGEEGLQLVKHNDYSIILLDVMMPKMDGYTMLAQLRTFSDVPVILLTAKGEQTSKVRGFIKGCDDYIVKPFDFTELSFRIQAILKRMQSSAAERQTDILSVKDLQIDLLGHCVRKDDRELNLTATEYEILRILSINRGRVYSTKMLYEMVWKDSFPENDRSVITHIRNLREKIGDSVKGSKYIKTIWGVGYKIEKED